MHPDQVVRTKSMHQSYYDNGPYLPYLTTVLLWHDDFPFLVEEYWNSSSE